MLQPKKKSIARIRFSSFSLILAILLMIPLFGFQSAGIRYQEMNTFPGLYSNNPGNISVIGDLDNDGYLDIIMTVPTSSDFNTNGGTAYLFFGSEGGFGEIIPANADIIFYGDDDHQLSSSVAVWDSEGTGWAEIVFGCPGDENGNGSALVFDSVLVNGSPPGTTLGFDRAQTKLVGTDTFGFGGWMETGHFTDGGTHELVIISTGDDTRDPGIHLFTGDGNLEESEEANLPSLSVGFNTFTTTLDMMARGKDALIYSAPERGEVRVAYLDMTTSLIVDIKNINGANGLGTTLFSGDVDGDGMEDLLIGNAKQSRVRVFYGNDAHWDSLGAINSEMDNVTITGEGGSGFGTSMAMITSSPFTPEEALIISQPWLQGEDGTGAVALFDLPLEGELLAPFSDSLVLPAQSGKMFGISVISIGDTDHDDYPEFIVASIGDDDRIRLIKYDRGPNPPNLSLDSPSREAPLKGVVKIKATVTDPDGDANPHDVRFYRSIDNKSWSPEGNGTPDRVEGDQAIKEWNTSNDENRIFFLKVEVTDAFGLTTARYSNSVEVFNHEPPTILLIYPIGGTTLKGSEEITARLILASKEELAPPVKFFYSRDGDTWENMGNTTQPNQDSGNDYTYLLNTRSLPDGPIYFRVNATTVYGLGSETQNDIPCFIDNAYTPEIEFTGNYSGNITEMLNITARITDRDDDIDPPVELFYREYGTVAWEFLGNMTGPVENYTFFYDLDTTTLENGEYEFRIHVQDLTFNQNESVLNRTVVIHNLYTPIVEIMGLNGSSIVKGIQRLRAAIWDRDGNFDVSGISFYYRNGSVEFWNRIPQVLLNNGIAIVDWDTTGLANGMYDLLVEVIDHDGLTGTDTVTGFTVSNIRAPVVEGSLPSTGGKLSGEVVITFNVTDDQMIPIENIIVEVFVLSGWQELEGVERVYPDLTFVPGKPVSYRVLWDTTTLDEDGERLYPDAPGYELRIIVTDSDGETNTWTTPISFRVDNTEMEIPGLNGEEENTLDPGMIAIMVFAGIILVVILLIAFLIWNGRKSEKKGTLPVVTSTGRKNKDIRPVEEESKEEEPERDEEEDIYSPSGWGGDTSSMYEIETPQEEESPEYGPEPTTVTDDDLFSDIFAVGGAPKAAPTPPPEAVGDLGDIDVDVDLPEEAMPSVEEPEEDWENVEDWEDDEEDWEELDEMDENDWEDEQEEAILVISCKCGEEIEIPQSRKKSRFECPSCGRTGKLRI